MPGAGATSHHITVPRTARFWTLEPGGDVALGTLYVLHGYGQLAEYFIRKFQPVADAGWRIIAPEGGHRFYLEGTSGKVGASWMTKEDRLHDITDHVAFLDTLFRLESPSTRDQGAKVVLGFSQGVATALRWLALGRQGPSAWEGVIAHSGVIPPDLPEMLLPASGLPDVHLIGGLQDPYTADMDAGFSTSEQEWVRIGGRSDQIHRTVFHGGHTIDIPSVLGALDGILS